MAYNLTGCAVQKAGEIMGRVHERALSATVSAILAFGDQAVPMEKIAEETSYSYVHMTRIVGCLLATQVIAREGGRRGVPFRYTVNLTKAEELGLYHAAA